MSLLNSLFGKKAQPSVQQTGYNALPDFAQNAFKDLVTRSQTASQAAPNTYQQGALDYLGQGARLPAFNFGQQANQAFGNASNYINNATGYLQDASQNVNRGVNPITGQEINTNIGYFMNPFENQVVQSTMNDINRQGASAYSDINALASDAGAFGGTRQAARESDLTRDLMRQVANSAGQLRYSGFQNASNQALQKLTDERNRFLTGAGINLNQAGTAINQGNAATNLGGNLMNARMDAESIRNQQAANQMGAGNFQQDQLKFLGDILSRFPGTSSAWGPQAATQGLLGTGGATASAGNLLSTGAKLFTMGAL
jgi:hypothetical protein